MLLWLKISWRSEWVRVHDHVGRLIDRRIYSHPHSTGQHRVTTHRTLLLTYTYLYMHAYEQVDTGEDGRSHKLKFSHLYLEENIIQRALED